MTRAVRTCSVPTMRKDALFIFSGLLILASCKKSETQNVPTGTANAPPSPAAAGASLSAGLQAPETLAMWVKVNNVRAAWKGLAHYAHEDDSSPDKAFSQLFQGEALKLLKLDSPMAIALPLAGMNSPAPVFALDVGDYSAAKNAFKTTTDGAKLHVNGILTSAGGPGVSCDLVNDHGAGRLVCGKTGDIDTVGAFAATTLFNLRTEAMVTLEVLPQHARGMLKMAPMMLAQGARDPAQAEQVSKLVDLLLDTRAFRVSLTPDAAALQATWRLDVDGEQSSMAKQLKAAALAPGNTPTEFDALTRDALLTVGGMRDPNAPEDAEALNATLAQLGVPAELGPLLQAAKEGPGKVKAYTLQVRTVMGEPVAIMWSQLDAPRDIAADAALAKKAVASLKGRPFGASVVGPWSAALPKDTLRVTVKLPASAKTPASVAMATVYDGTRMWTLLSPSTKALDAAYTELKAPASSHVGDIDFLRDARKAGGRQLGAVRVDSLVAWFVALQGSKGSWGKALTVVKEQQAENVAPMSFASYASGANASAKAFSIWGELSVPGSAIDAVYNTVTARRPR